VFPSGYGHGGAVQVLSALGIRGGASETSVLIFCVQVLEGTTAVELNDPMVAEEGEDGEEIREVRV
jgi:hypothetical protein